MKEKLKALLGQLERMAALAERRDSVSRNALNSLFPATINGVKALIKESK